MTYFYNTPQDKKAMLKSIGAESIEDLLSGVPAEVRLKRPLDIPPALTEIELTSAMRELAGKNYDSGKLTCFGGGGCYDHFVPAVVDVIASRSEFYTSYTPYQAEVSQGNLQAMFEYQTLVTRLTGMDISNSSVYDGASAAAEAALMALSCTKRFGNVVVAGNLHPEYRETIATYLENLQTEVLTAETADGVVDVEKLGTLVSDETACVIVQHPNFFGCLEDMQAIERLTHERGALLVQAFDPISLGLLKRPGDYGVDIAVAEGQSLGTPMSYGGPYLGIMACRKEFVRRMPGRIVGETVDRRGNRCYVLTLQTREQHIRREKSTSNICTNQSLFALRAAVYLAEMGPVGMREVAELCMNKARYAADAITAGDRFSLAMPAPTFKEFVVRDHEGRVDEVLDHAMAEGMLAGIPLGRWYPEYQDCFFVAVTEQRSKQQIDELAAVLNATPPRSKQRPLATWA